MNRRELLKASLLTLPLLAIRPMEVLSIPYNASFTTLKKSDFGPDFKWGVATAAYQIEGNPDADGKGVSIWDTFTHGKKNIMNGDTGDVACDFYNRYDSDIDIMRSLNLDVFRFSISWPRIMPDGTGKVNQKGVDFYHRVIDSCLEKGIEPWLTCYHWDLPQALQDKGGWASRDIVNWFADYVHTIGSAYGDKVKNWMVLNEPAGFTSLGYMLGMHAPGIRSLKQFMKSVHFTNLSMAEGGRALRDSVTDGNIGSTWSCSSIEPKNGLERHLDAARKLDALVNRLFIEPCLGMGYPFKDLPLIKRLEQYIEPGDEEALKFDFDFIGIQNYMRLVARFSLWPPIMWANIVDAKKLVEDPADLTEMKWEVNPEGIYRVIKQFAKYGKKIIVTENGAAFPDVLEDGYVHDAKRLDFYQQYLKNILKAKQEGVDIGGYFAWTFMDNFEWAEGYHPRFGLVHTNFETQERIIKDSGLWFQEFLK